MTDTLHIDPARVARLRDPKRLEDLDPELVWHAITPLPDGVIVDVGAGVGFLTLPFANKFPRARIYACDILPGMLELLQESAAEQSLTNIDCMQMDSVLLGRIARWLPMYSVVGKTHSVSERTLL